MAAEAIGELCMTETEAYILGSIFANIVLLAQTVKSASGTASEQAQLGHEVYALFQSMKDALWA